MYDLILRLRVWANTFFDELWRLVPAQPILFPFFFAGGLISLVFPPATGLLVPGPIYAIWVTLALVCPAMVLGAWRMILDGRGDTRYFGLWMRLGGDAGQAFVLMAYILVPQDLSSRGYGLLVDLGVTAFVLVLVVRDVWAIWFVEQLASKIRLQLNEDHRNARQ